MAKLLGPNCTPRAVQEQLKKLKKVGLEEAAAAASRTGVVAASPKKRSKLSASKGPKKEKLMKADPKEESKEKVEEEDEEGDKDNESVLPSPAKRARRSDLDEDGHGGETEFWQNSGDQ